MIAFLMRRIVMKIGLIVFLLLAGHTSAVAQPVFSVRFTNETGKPLVVALDQHRRTPFRVIWGTSFGSLVCSVLDQEGHPVAGAKMYANTNESHTNANVIAEPTRNFTEYLGETGVDGTIKVENVPTLPIDIRVVVPNYMPLDSIDQFQIAEKGSLSVESKAPLVIKWTPRKED